MNITLRNMGVSPTQDTTSVSIPTTDNGSEYKTLINVASGITMIPTATVSDKGYVMDMKTVRTMPITIIGTSEESRSGVRRVLIKVELPYASVQKCACESGSQYQVEDGASGAPISLHMVLTLPKQACVDLQNPGETQDGVYTRIMLLQYLLESLIRINGNALNQETSWHSALPSGFVQVGSYQNVWTVGGLTTDGTNAPDPAWTTTSPLLRGASLLKPFINSETYGLGSTH